MTSFKTCVHVSSLRVIIQNVGFHQTMQNVRGHKNNLPKTSENHAILIMTKHDKTMRHDNIDNFVWRITNSDRTSYILYSEYQMRIITQYYTPARKEYIACFSLRLRGWSCTHHCPPQNVDILGVTVSLATLSSQILLPKGLGTETRFGLAGLLSLHRIQFLS